MFLLDAISGEIARGAHLVGICLVIYALFMAVRSLERGDLFVGLTKALVYGMIGAMLSKL